MTLISITNSAPYQQCSMYDGCQVRLVCFLICVYQACKRVRGLPSVCLQAHKARVQVPELPFQSLHLQSGSFCLAVVAPLLLRGHRPALLDLLQLLLLCSVHSTSKYQHSSWTTTEILDTSSTNKADLLCHSSCAVLQHVRISA